MMYHLHSEITKNDLNSW